MNNQQISIRQFKILVFFFSVGTSILIIPTGLAADAKQDAWIAASIGLLFGIVYILLITTLARRMLNKNFSEFSKDVLGSAAGTVMTVIFNSIGFIGSATLLFYVGDFMTTQILIGTPPEAIQLLFIVIVVMSVRLGLETMARTAEILFPYFNCFISLDVSTAPS
jgi:spore germination protein KB